MGAVDVEDIDRVVDLGVGGVGEAGDVAHPLGDAGASEVGLERCPVSCRLVDEAGELLRTAIVAGVRVDRHDLDAGRRAAMPGRSWSDPGSCRSRRSGRRPGSVPRRRTGAGPGRRSSTPRRRRPAPGLRRVSPAQPRSDASDRAPARERPATACVAGERSRSHRPYTARPNRMTHATEQLQHAVAGEDLLGRRAPPSLQHQRVAQQGGQHGHDRQLVEGPLGGRPVAGLERPLAVAEERRSARDDEHDAQVAGACSRRASPARAGRRRRSRAARHSACRRR